VTLRGLDAFAPQELAIRLGTALVASIVVEPQPALFTDIHEQHGCYRYTELVECPSFPYDASHHM
jgi:hypothetical protein